MSGARLHAPRLVHSASFTVSYTPEDYGRVLASQRDEFKVRFSIADQALMGDRIWARLTLYRTDPDTGQHESRAAMQTYRVEGGRLVETWVVYHPLGNGMARHRGSFLSTSPIAAAAFSPSSRDAR